MRMHLYLFRRIQRHHGRCATLISIATSKLRSRCSLPRLWQGQGSKQRCRHNGIDHFIMNTDGSAAARLTPDQKFGSSSLSGLILRAIAHNLAMRFLWAMEAIHRKPHRSVAPRRSWTFPCSQASGFEVLSEHQPESWRPVTSSCFHFLTRVGAAISPGIVAQAKKQAPKKFEYSIMTQGWI